jgi:hypothetical protein
MTWDWRLAAGVGDDVLNEGQRRRTGVSDPHGFNQRLKPALLFQALAAALKRCSTQKFRAVCFGRNDRAGEIPTRDNSALAKNARTGSLSLLKIILLAFVMVRTLGRSLSPSPLANEFGMTQKQERRAGWPGCFLATHLWGATGLRLLSPRIFSIVGSAPLRTAV